MYLKDLIHKIFLTRETKKINCIFYVLILHTSTKVTTTTAPSSQ